MTRCRLSAEGKRRGFRHGKQDREGEYLGPYQRYVSGYGENKKYVTEYSVVRVLWDGTKGIQQWSRDFIEIIGEEKPKSEPPENVCNPDWGEWLWLD